MSRWAAEPSLRRQEKESTSKRRPPAPGKQAQSWRTHGVPLLARLVHLQRAARSLQRGPHLALIDGGRPAGSAGQEGRRDGRWILGGG